MKIDLRSDTVTRPTPGMKEAMMNAIVGDDVFEEDPTVQELEAHCAQLFGHEAGIYCPSGTMTNQIAIRIQTTPGSEVICHEDSHVYNYEGGGIAVNSLSSVRLLHGNRGRIKAEEVVTSINPNDVHKPVTALVSVEDTSNRGGGCWYDVDELKAIRAACNEHGLPLHLDGARVFNALVERGDDWVEFGRLFDTISICLSKGLGAPIGSVLLGSKDKIKQARRVRKVLGGGMRQVGLLAAAGRYALDNHVDRLTEDHARAKRLGAELESCNFVSQVLPVETNIIVFELNKEWKPAELLAQLEAQGVMAVPFGGQLVRFVTHLDFDDDQLTRLTEILRAI